VRRYDAPKIRGCYVGGWGSILIETKGEGERAGVGWGILWRNRKKITLVLERWLTE